jgi:hypothetical protein
MHFRIYPRLRLALIRLRRPCWFVWFFLISAAALAEPILQVVQSAHNSLLKNGQFEEVDTVRFSNWNPAPQGYQVAVGEGRNNSKAIVVDNVPGTGWFGASQTIILNRTPAAPLVVQGWSKAVNVTGGSDSGYSLYVDLTYADGSPLWGQTANFHAGTHDWQMRRFTIFPEKPVKSLTLHCLFRGHAGKAWFDDVSVGELSATNDMAIFQGAAVKAATPALDSAKNARLIESNDGLRLAFGGDVLSRIRLGARELKTDRPGGFLVRDVAADSDFFNFTNSACPELGLKIQAQMVGNSNHIAIEGRVSDITGKDRAITLVFALPVTAEGWNWGDDIRRSRAISGNGEFSKQVSVKCGASGTESLYPIAPIWDKDSGLAIGLDMSHPAVFRTGYHAGLKTLFIAYDFALVKDTDRFPSSADFRLVLYRFPANGGFRAAWEKFMEIFPAHFEVRAQQQGLWMPFTDISKVKGWEDFGFRFHEGNNNVKWDDEHGILSFRYTEPMTWWMPMKKEMPRTFPDALRVRDEIAQGSESSRRRMAKVTEISAMQDETGEPALLFRNEPWANGAVWSLNPNPLLTATNATLNAATVYWNDEIKERLYGAGARGQLDGEYLDSLEGYVTAELNFRREHFRFSTVPLTFSAETKQPVLFKGLAIYEFTRWLAEDVHKMGKLMFANGVPYRFAWLCPWLDVLGTETDWLRDGKYHPVALETTDLWRTLAGGKPYLLLMNTDYDVFTPDHVEKYFQRALFYGMWPGFFSHNAADNPYWQTPKWYERDRPLFRKYIPLIRRVAEAGWRPVTRASCENQSILFERFGPDRQANVYLTLFNNSVAPQTGIVAVDASVKSLRTVPKPLIGSAPERDGANWRISLGSEEVAVWQLSAGD